ncbi:MAG: hypothetical protein HFJ17_05215 [Clostridia bacterium]|nr:hypothetical protein [Clostridia bacterium]
MEKRYSKIVLERGEGIEYTIKEEGEVLKISAVLKDAAKAEEKYFFEITEKEREEVSTWIEKQNVETEKEKEFIKIVKEGLKEVKYNYFISTIEPSVNKTTGKLQFKEKEEPVISEYPWGKVEKMCQEYNPERGSRSANLYELFIWYALRIARGLWTLDFVANDSSSGGNYYNTPNAAHKRELAGARECGGFRDGIGNTYKAVAHKGGLALVGGSCSDNGKNRPVADVGFVSNPNFFQYCGSCVVVLTKLTTATN